MKKAVLFVRVSTEKQTLESQIAALKRTAFIDGYGDNDIIVIAKKESGVKLKEAEREGLNELKSVIEQNDVDCVYIFELSRLSRDPMTLYSVRDKIFKNNKVQLKCLKPSFSLLEEPDRIKFDTMGSLVFSIFGCFAEQEVVEKKERFHRGKKQKAIDVLPGVIINVLDFGAFVKLSEGVSGLLHRSEVRWDEPAPNMKDIFKYGDKVKVVVCRIDHEQGRLFLSIKRLDTTKLSDVYKAGSIHSARVKLVTDKFVTLELPYEVRAQVRTLRFAKAGVMPKEGDEVEVQVMTYTPETNNIKVALRLEQAA
jgi:predicted RNA-binding protein with RPS1 domain